MLVNLRMVLGMFFYISFRDGNGVYYYKDGSKFEGKFKGESYVKGQGKYIKTNDGPNTDYPDKEENCIVF